MQGKGRPTTHIILLAALNTLLVTFVLFLLAEVLATTRSWYMLVLFAAATMASGMGVIYYFYHGYVSKRLDTLSQRIRQRFASREVPTRSGRDDKQDSLQRLEQGVNSMIEAREKEMAHFQNLDSYRKEYLGNVSHELKTPVFNIQGYVDTLLNGGLNDPSINTEYLRRAESSIDRLISIIDDLETITHMESGRLILDIDAFDIATLIKEVYASLELNAAKKKIRLELTRKYDKPVLVLADKFRIRQVLVNLVANSIKYGREQGTTTTDISYLHDDVVVTISDNGAGIDEKHLPRIFERFYRIDKGRSREQGGTGLGLAIVKHILDAHGKSIRVESRLGKGTAFTFALPAVP